MAVCVGAMMVGSIKTTVEEGESVQRGQEFGYFAFGTSLSLYNPFSTDTFNFKFVIRRWFNNCGSL